MVYVMEELVKFTLLTRVTKDYMADRYSEHIESADNLTSGSTKIYDRINTTKSLMSVSINFPMKRMLLLIISHLKNLIKPIINLLKLSNLERTEVYITC